MLTFGNLNTTSHCPYSHYLASLPFSNFLTARLPSHSPPPSGLSNTGARALTRAPSPHASPLMSPTAIVVVSLCRLHLVQVMQVLQAEDRLLIRVRVR